MFNEAGKWERRESSAASSLGADPQHAFLPWATEASALNVSCSGFYAWLNRSASARSPHDEVLLDVTNRSFKGGDRTYGSRRV